MAIFPSNDEGLRIVATREIANAPTGEGAVVTCADGSEWRRCIFPRTGVTGVRVAVRENNRLKPVQT